MDATTIQKSLDDLGTTIDARLEEIRRLRESNKALLAACKDVLAAQRAGELSYRSSDGCGYEAMLAVEAAIKGA